MTARHQQSRHCTALNAAMFSLRRMRCLASRFRALSSLQLAMIHDVISTCFARNAEHGAFVGIHCTHGKLRVAGSHPAWHSTRHGVPPGTVSHPARCPTRHGARLHLTWSGAQRVFTDRWDGLSLPARAQPHRLHHRRIPHRPLRRAMHRCQRGACFTCTPLAAPIQLGLGVHFVRDPSSMSANTPAPTGRAHA